MNQRGITPVLIVAALAVVFVIGAISYGVYIATNKASAPAKEEIPVSENASLQPTIQVGTPECPEVDYTGCDTSGEFMTWKDDGVRNPPTDSSESTIQLK